MSDRQTSVLSTRLHRLADDVTPPLDVVATVRSARSGHHRRRRTRLALVAVAAATVAVVGGTTAVIDAVSADPVHGDVATSGTSSATSAPATGPATSAAPTTASTTVPTTVPTAPATTAPASSGGESSDRSTGMERRSFLGVDFAVPTGARTADTEDLRPVASWMEGPSLTWNGPPLGDGRYSYVTVMVVETYEGGLTPTDGGDWLTVPGASLAYGGIDVTTTEDGGGSVELHMVWMHVLDGDRQILVNATFGGPSAEQLARDLIGSLSIT